MSVDCDTHVRGFTQSEVKRRSLVDLCFGPDASTVFSDDALHRGQSHAGPFKCLVAASDDLICNSFTIPHTNGQGLAIRAGVETKMEEFSETGNRAPKG